MDYIVNGPLLNGATIPWPKASPTIQSRAAGGISSSGTASPFSTPRRRHVRLLMKYGEDWPKKYDLPRCVCFGSVGEPINPEAWEWFYRVTGAINPSWTPGGKQKPARSWSAPLPSVPPARFSHEAVPRIEADVVDKEGNSLPSNAGGSAVIKKPWPAMMRTIY